MGPRLRVFGKVTENFIRRLYKESAGRASHGKKACFGKLGMGGCKERVPPFCVFLSVFLERCFPPGTMPFQSVATI